MSEPDEVTPEFAAAAAQHHDDIVAAATAARDGARQALADLADQHAAQMAGAQGALDAAEQALTAAESERDRWAELAGDTPPPPRIVVVTAQAGTATAGTSASRGRKAGK